MNSSRIIYQPRRDATTESEVSVHCQSFKSARVPTVDEVGTLKDCIHDFASGKGCYVCDPNHPYRLEQGNKT